MKPPRDIDPALLRAFIAVAETGRMTTAAKVVHLTQSAVSQRIKRLEALFERALFERQADAARPTRDGERLLAHAHRLLALNDEVISDMTGGDFAGEVRLGVAHDVVGAMMPAVLRAFSRRHPQALVTLVSDTSTTLRAQLRHRELDLALLTEAERGTREQWLFADQLVWVGAPGGQAARQRPLSIALGTDKCSFRAAAVEALRGARIKWRAICQVGSLQPVFATLEADLAVGVFLRRTVPTHLEIARDAGLPALPRFHLNLRAPAQGVQPIAGELMRHIRDELATRYA